MVPLQVKLLLMRYNMLGFLAHTWCFQFPVSDKLIQLFLCEGLPHTSSLLLLLRLYSKVVQVR